MIKFPADIFSLNFEKIKDLDGWGKLSANNLEKAINKSKNISLDKFIYSIGIRHIGQENAKLIAGYFISVKKSKNIEWGEILIELRNFITTTLNESDIQNYTENISSEDLIIKKSTSLEKEKIYRSVLNAL